MVAVVVVAVEVSVMVVLMLLMVLMVLLMVLMVGAVWEGWGVGGGGFLIGNIIYYTDRHQAKKFNTMGYIEPLKLFLL